jgi:hypothetical protein
VATTALRTSSLFCPAAAAASPRAVYKCANVKVGGWLKPFFVSTLGPWPSPTQAHTHTRTHTHVSKHANKHVPRRSLAIRSFRCTSFATGFNTPLRTPKQRAV